MSQVAVTEDAVSVTVAETPERRQATKSQATEKNFIIVTNLDGTGRNVLICETRLDHVDIWLTLIHDGRKFDEVRIVDMEPWPLPPDTSLMFLTPRGEYDIERNIALRTPSLAPFFPPWEELTEEKRREYGEVTRPVEDTETPTPSAQDDVPSTKNNILIGGINGEDRFLLIEGTDSTVEDIEKVLFMRRIKYSSIQAIGSEQCMKYKDCSKPVTEQDAQSFKYDIMLYDNMVPFFNGE